MEKILKKIEELETDPDIGLLSGMVDIRLQKYGKNILYEIPKISYSSIIFNSIFSIENLFLLFIAVFFIYIKKFHWLIYPATFILMNAILMFYEYIKVYNLLLLHIKNIKFKVKVVRNKKVQITDAEEIVPGDIIILEKGDIVPADVLLLEVKDFQIDNEKSGSKTTGCEVLKWSIVKSGQAKSLVLRTAKNCENNIAKSFNIEDIPFFKKNRKLQNIYNLMIFLFFVFLLISTRNLFISFFFLEGCITLKLLFWGKNLFARFLKLNFASGIIINNFSKILKKISSPPLLIIDKIDTILKPEYAIRKIYTDGKLIEVSDNYNSIDGDFYLRNLNILKERNWEKKEEELKNKYLLYKQNRKNPNPYDEFKKINPLKSESLKTSILIGKLTSCGELEKSLSGIATFSGHPIDFAFLILSEKAKIKEEGYELIKREKIDSTEIAFVKFEKKYFVFLKASAEFVIDRSLWFLHNGKKISFTIEREKELKNIINLLSCQSHKVYATAYQELSENEFNNFKKLNNPLNGIKKLVLTALFGIKVELNEMFPEIKDKINNVILITEDNKYLVEYLLKKSKMLKENEKIITPEEFSQMSTVDYLNIKNNIKAYAEFKKEQKIPLIDFFSKKNDIVFLISDDFLGYENCIKILNAELSNEKEKLESDLIINKNLLSAISNLYNCFNNFCYGLKLIVTEKFMLNIIRIITLGAIILFMSNYFKFVLITPLIFSLYIEFILALCYKRFGIKKFIKFSSDKNLLSYFILKTILISCFVLSLIYYSNALNILFGFLFVSLILDFFYATENIFFASVKVTLILSITYFVPFLNCLLNIEEISGIHFIVFGIYALILHIVKRSSF